MDVSIKSTVYANALLRGMTAVKAIKMLVN